jgi:hypothetical protein
MSLTKVVTFRSFSYRLIVRICFTALYESVACITLRSVTVTIFDVKMYVGVWISLTLFKVQAHLDDI